MTRRFEFREGTSQKFWEVDIIRGPDSPYNQRWVMIRSWGRIGQTPTSKQFFYGEEYKAIEEMDKLIRTKLREGYMEVRQNPFVKPAPKVAPIVGVPTGRMVSNTRTTAPPQPSTPKKCSRCKDRVASSGTQNSPTPLCQACISTKVEPQKPASKDDNPMDRFRLIELE
jgi:predicted DNA-binding WGR domain protein